MITQKTKYAFKALMTLAAEQQEGGSALTIEEIADRSGAPKRFLEHILLDLKRSGFIGSRRGRKGGYELIKAPKQISLGEVLRLVDGPIAPLPCLSRRAYRKCDDCEDEETCRVRHVFGQVFWAYLLLIESLTVADLVDNGTIERLATPAVAAGE